jgi:hypothetical protein
LNLSEKLTVNFLFALLFSICLIGCGGGETASPTTPSPAGPTLQWDPPQSFADQTPLDPARDLENYEIFVNETGTFPATETPAAVVSAVEPTSGSLVTSFNLGNLGPFLDAGKTYHLSMRSVSRTGIKSDFSPAVSFAI